MERMNFTMADALQIQANQMEDIKTVLNAETYKALEEHVEAKNIAGYPNPFAVFRGQNLTEFVDNLASENGRALRKERE